MSQENVLSPSPEPRDVRSLAEKYLDTLSPKEKKRISSPKNIWVLHLILKEVMGLKNG
jgi:hypothetical protein